MVRSFPQDKNQGTEQSDCADLCRGQRHLYYAARLHAKVLDKGNKENRHHGQQTHSRVAETKEISRIACQHHGNGRQNSSVHYKKHRPSPEEPQGRRINLLQKDIHAAGIWKKTR